MHWKGLEISGSSFFVLSLLESTEQVLYPVLKSPAVGVQAPLSQEAEAVLLAGSLGVSWSHRYIPVTWPDPTVKTFSFTETKC